MKQILPKISPPILSLNSFLSNVLCILVRVKKTFISSCLNCLLFIILATILSSNAHAASDAKVTIIGDSITVRSESDIKKLLPNVQFDAAVGRNPAQGILALQSMHDLGKLQNQDVVVFELGTNGPISSSEIGQVLNIASHKKVILVTVYGLSGDVPWMDSVNKTIHDEAKSSSEISIADWSSLVSNHKDWIDTGAHPYVHPTNGTGTQQFAKLIADTVVGATPSIPSGNSGSGNNTPNGSTSDSASYTTTTCIKGQPCIKAENGTNNSLVKAAQDLFDAYTICQPSPSFTFSSVAKGNCLGDKLQAKGYSGDVIKTISNMESFWDGSRCVECVGFVRQAIVLANGTEDPRLKAANGNTPVLQNWASIVNGSHTFKHISGHIPQAGDIAIARGGEGENIGTDFGHILVVKSVTGDKFVGVEANWDAIDGQSYSSPSCKVADDVVHTPLIYDFYRDDSPTTVQKNTTSQTTNNTSNIKASIYISLNKEKLYASENGKVVQTYDISTGKPGNETVRGSGKLVKYWGPDGIDNSQGPGYSVDGGLWVGAYWQLFPNGDNRSQYLIHPWPFEGTPPGCSQGNCKKGPFVAPPSDGNYTMQDAIGQHPQSHGCIQMWPANSGHPDFYNFTAWSQKFNEVSFQIGD